MTPAAIIEQATADGVRLTLSPGGGIKASGDRAAVGRWLPAIRDHKLGIVAALREAANDEPHHAASGQEARELLVQLVRMEPEHWSGADVVEAFEAIERDPAGWRDCFAAILESKGAVKH